MLKEGDKASLNENMNSKINELKQQIINNNTAQNISQIDLINNEQLMKAFLFFKELISNSSTKNNELTELLLNCNSNSNKHNQQVNSNGQSRINSSLIKDSKLVNENISNRIKPNDKRPNSKSQSRPKALSIRKGNISQVDKYKKLQLNLSPPNSRYSSNKRMQMSPVSARKDNTPMTPAGGPDLMKEVEVSSDVNSPKVYAHSRIIKSRVMNNKRMPCSPKSINEIHQRIESKHNENRLKRKQRDILIQQENSKVKDCNITLSKQTPSSMNSNKKDHSMKVFKCPQSSSISHSQINPNESHIEAVNPLPIKSNDLKEEKQGLSELGKKDEDIDVIDKKNIQVMNQQDSHSKIKQLQIITPLCKSTPSLVKEEHYLSDNIHDLKEYDLQYYPSPRGGLSYNINPQGNNTALNPNEILPNDLLAKKLNELNKEIGRLKIENIRVLKLREEYECLNQKLWKELKDNKLKREEEEAIFNAFKEDELKKLQKGKKQFAHELQVFTDNKVKNQVIPSLNKKSKEAESQLRSQLLKLQEDSKLKENNSKLAIDRYKKQLEEAYSEINDLKTELAFNRKSKGKLHRSQSQIYSSHKSKEISYRSRANHERKGDNSINNHSNCQPFLKGSNSSSNTINMQLRPIPSFLNKPNEMNYDNEEEDESEDTFDIVFPEKYHKAEYKLLKQETGDDGRITRIFDKDKKEVIFTSGVRKELYGDGYQIIYFTNGDVKQMYPNGKTVYYFSEAKTIQTTFKSHQVFKFENGQIEKHFKDGTVKIAFLDGSLRYILPDGSEETYYLDGRVHKIDCKGVVSFENEDGSKELHYPDGKEVIGNRKAK